MNEMFTSNRESISFATFNDQRTPCPKMMMMTTLLKPVAAQSLALLLR